MEGVGEAGREGNRVREVRKDEGREGWDTLGGRQGEGGRGVSKVIMA